MATIQQFNDYDGEWHKLVLENEVIYEGHEIPDFAWRELLKKLGFAVSVFDWDAETGKISEADD
jgi:hypothetical protein